MVESLILTMDLCACATAIATIGTLLRMDFFQNESGSNLFSLSQLIANHFCEPLACY